MRFRRSLIISVLIIAALAMLALTTPPDPPPPASSLHTFASAASTCDNTAAAPGGALILSPSGNNANPGTLASPKASLTGWVPVNGTTILLRGGTYPSWGEIGWGGPFAAAANITIASYPGELAIVRGDYFATFYGSSANNITIRNLRLELTGGTSGIINGSAGYAGGAPHHITVRCNIFWRAASGHGVYLGGNGAVGDSTALTNNRLHDWTISYNDFVGFSRFSAWHTGPSQTQAAIHSYHVNGAYDVTIDHNGFADSDYGILVSAEGQANWSIDHNSFAGNTVGIGLTAYAEACTATGGSPVCRDWQQIASFTVTANVLDVPSTGTGISIEAPWTFAPRLSLGALPVAENNNLVFGGACPIRLNGSSGSGGTCYSTMTAWRAATMTHLTSGATLAVGLGTGDISTDPVLANPSAGDFATPAGNQASLNGWGCCPTGSPATTTTSGGSTTTTAATTTTSPGTVTLTVTPSCQSGSTFTFAAVTSPSASSVTVAITGPATETLSLGGSGTSWSATDNLPTGTYNAVATATFTGGTATSSTITFERSGSCTTTTTTTAPGTTTSTTTPTTTTTLATSVTPVCAGPCPPSRFPAPAAGVVAAIAIGAAIARLRRRGR